MSNDLPPNRRFFPDKPIGPYEPIYWLVVTREPETVRPISRFAQLPVKKNTPSYRGREVGKKRYSQQTDGKWSLAIHSRPLWTDSCAAILNKGTCHPRNEQRGVLRTSATT